MPAFSPFRSLRYDPARFAPEDVTAPPYDVLSAEDRAALVAKNPHNAVLIDLPTEDDGDDRYAAAGHRLRAWTDEGVVALDPHPELTAYRMTTTDDLGKPVATLGVLGALTLSRPDEGEILPHEHTTPKAKSDRLDLLRGTRANLSAIWGLSLAPGLSGLLDVDRPPFQSWTDEDGTRHETWRITDEDQIAAISDAVGSQPLVIADGHHRYETSLAYRDERRAADGSGGEADATLCYVVELSDEQLTVRPIHRLVRGFADLDLPEAIASLPGSTLAGTATAAEVADGRVLLQMRDLGAVAVVGKDGSAVLVSLDPSAYPDVDDLDSARLAEALDRVGPHELTYQHGTDRAQAAVTGGSADWAVLIRPVTVAAIEANAHSGKRMPPKSTFFYPKPRTGIVFRPLG
ncbi:DUF1015 family protein [Aquihabitans daechungensis]|uniref:DUF1015 family protein n=1 Tax=Aquihabitans daechungensis TaxID=1052257 RepID=UPI003BA3DF41